VNLFSNASRDVNEQNTHADFTVKLSQTVYLGSIPNSEVRSVKLRVLRITLGKPRLIDCNLIYPQFMGDSADPSMQTIRLSPSVSYEPSFGK